MGNLKTLEISLSDILCSTCKSDSPVEYESYTPYILYDVVVDGEDDDLPLTVTLDVKKIEWQKLPSGEYIAKASILIDCPCCRNPQTLKKIMQAPVVLIESLRKCKNCGAYLKLDEENVEYLETKNKKSSLSVRGKLSCDACNERQRININNDLPDDFWERESLIIFLNSDYNGIARNEDLITMREHYVDFDLHISPDGHVVASSSLGGEVSDGRIATVVPNEISLSLQLIENRKTNTDLLKNLGKFFYNWLLPGAIHTHFQQTEAVAKSRNMKIRLRLRIESEKIASLPLEFIYREVGGYFMGINPNTVLSRYLNLPLPPERVRRREGSLHMLTIIADPTDQIRLPPDTWETIIRESLANPLTTGQITLETVKRATRKEIRNALRRQTPDIIQFVGHGIYKDGRGYLALVNEDTDKTWLVDDETFANLYLGYDDHLGLISLATCESAKSENPQGFMGIAPKLVQRGIPAVLSMQYEVYVKTAKIFLEDFYTAVAAHKPIDWATQSARNAVSQELGLDNREFATPVLYMRSGDGQIF